MDDTWLQCARELRGLLISNDLASCSVEIVDPMVFTPVNTILFSKKTSVLGIGASPKRTFSSIGPNFNSIYWILPTW